MAAASSSDVLKTLKDKEVKFVDLRFTDTRGKEQHVQVPAKQFTQDKFDSGHAFDGSSIAGWKGIEASDMLLMPDPDSARIDPFTDETTLNITCDVVEPADGKGYDRDPAFARQARGGVSQVHGPGRHGVFRSRTRVLHFRLGDLARDMSGCAVKIESEEASWSSGTRNSTAATWVIAPAVKGGYFPVPPVDQLQDIRNAISLALEEQGVEVEVFHHEVATAGQNEIGTKFNTLVKRADWNQILKYTIWMVAHSYGKTATFMPKPIVGDNGSGMHVHQSVWKGGQNLFAGNGYAGLSEFALYYIGGVIKHAKALNAITNPGTNSYKRLVPGFEAPINLAYSATQSLGVVPHSVREQSEGTPRRSAFPRSRRPIRTCAFSALLMAGLDGVQNKIHPGDPIDKNLYDLPPEEAAKIPHPCASLDEALDHLDKDREFLTRGGVFSNDMIDAYIALKMEEVTRFRMTTHPIEFDMYYSL